MKLFDAIEKMTFWHFFVQVLESNSSFEAEIM